MQPIKVKTFTLFAVLTGVVTAVLFLRTESEPGSAWFVGYSVVRLGLGVLIVLPTIAAGLATVLAFSSLYRAKRIAGWLDTQLLVKQRLFPMMMFSIVAAIFCTFYLTLPLISQLPGDLSYAAAYLNRVWPMITWGLILILALLVVAFSSYPQVTLNSGWWASNIRSAFENIFARHTLSWLLLIIGVYVAAILYPYAPLQADKVPSHDSGIFLYFGEQILHGKIPFRDLWDHKPPLVFYINALGLWLGRGSMWGVWWLEVLSLAVASILAFLPLRRILGIGPALLAVTAMLTGMVFVLEGGNLTEEYAILYQFLALYLFLMPYRPNGHRASTRSDSLPVVEKNTSIHFERNYSSSPSTGANIHEPGGGEPRLFGVIGLSALRFFLIGAAFAGAFLLKQNLIGVWVAIGTYMLLDLLINHNRARLLELAWMAFGALIILLITTIYFAVNHSLYQLWDVAFRFNFLYSEINENQRASALGDLFRFLTQTSGLFIAGVATWIGVSIFLYKQRHVIFSINAKPILLLLFLTWLDFLLELVLISTSGRNYRHYFMSLMPSLTYLIAALAAGVVVLFRRYTRPLVWLVLALLWVFLVSASLPPLWDAMHPVHEVSLNEVISYVREHSSKMDTVLMWGSHTEINYMTGRDAPTRFVHTKPLFYEGYSTPAITNEFLSDLETKKPIMIINTRLDYLPFAFIEANGRCGIPETSHPVWVDPIYKYICDHYTLVDTIGKDSWQVWLRNDSPKK